MANRARSIIEIYDIAKPMEDIFGTLDIHKLAEKTKQGGSAAGYPLLRSFVLNAMGLEERPNPEHVIMTGCMLPFQNPFQLRNYFRLMDRLGVSYTCIKDKEYCVGLPILYSAKGEDLGEADKLARELIELNMAQVRALGAKKATYFCNRGYSMVKRLYQGSDIEVLYYPRAVLSLLENRQLKLKPTLVGYYHGCWQKAHLLNRDVKVDKKDFLDVLGRIEGVQVVELPHNMCCQGKTSAAIMEAAASYKVDCIVSPCADCQWAVSGLERAFRDKHPGQRRIEVKALSDVLFEAVDG